MRRLLPVFVLALALALAGCGPAAEGPPTFHRDLAPLLHAECAACHRPGGSAPFALLRYDEARNRAAQMADVVATGYMPPWLPEPGHGDFVGERRLTGAEIELFARWADAGRLEGDPSDAPAAPEFGGGWTLGEPDLVAALPEPAEVPAGGADLYRNFVIPAPSPDRDRWIRAIEFRSDNPRVVHHARILIDRSGRLARRDAAEPGPGFGGMDPGGAKNPDGILLGWTPGKLPSAGDPELAWRLGPDTDVVVQLHLTPTGKPETVGVRLGLHEADGPPAKQPFALVLGTRRIEIPAGAADHVVEDAFTLPVDVRVHAIYPHAHYLGKTMRVEAHPPDDGDGDGAAEPIPLIRIDDWDFNWQDEYRYRKPVALPAGTRIAMRYTYDNSAANPQNPHVPPRPVLYGAETTDEMAEVSLQVVPVDPADLPALEQAALAHTVEEAIAYRRWRLERAPDEASSWAALGSSLMAVGKFAEALEPLTRAAELAPGEPSILNNLGYALLKEGRAAEAAERLGAAATRAPGSAEIRFNLAQALERSGDRDGAVTAYRAVLRLQPDAEAARARLQALGVRR